MSAVPAPVIFDEHSGVVAHWFATDRQPRTLLCLDAHLDLQALPAAAAARLAACRDAADVAALERPHPLCPGDDWAYGLEDWIVPAHRLGLVDRVVWVVPPHVGARFDGRALVQLSQTDGVDVAALQSFHRNAAGLIEGLLLGVPVTMCSLEQVPSLGLPDGVRLDIDIDYFITVPGDRPWAQPQAVAAVLRHAVPRPAGVTICRSVASGFTPPALAGIAEALAAQWRGDAPLPAPPPAPGADVLREACAFRHRLLPLTTAHAHALRQHLQQQAPPADAAWGLWAWAAVGLLFAELGQLPDALQCYAECAQRAGGHAELSLQVARLALQAGRTDLAAEHLRQAAADARCRTAALLLLGRLHLSAGRPADAWPLLAEAAGRAPAWADLLASQRAAAAALGLQADAARIDAALRTLAETASALRQRLA